MKRKTDTENEQDQISRLMRSERKKRPSRKYTETRAPRDDVRRRRIQMPDDDLATFDKDISMSQKHASSLSWDDPRLSLAADYDDDRLLTVYGPLRTITKTLNKLGPKWLAKYQSIMRNELDVDTVDLVDSPEKKRVLQEIFRVLETGLTYWRSGDINWEKFNNKETAQSYFLALWNGTRIIESISGAPETVVIHENLYKELHPNLGVRINDSKTKEQEQEILQRCLLLCLRAGLVFELKSHASDREGHFRIFPDQKRTISNLIKTPNKDKLKYLSSLSVGKLIISMLYNTLFNNPDIAEGEIKDNVFKKADDEIKEVTESIAKITSIFSADTLLTTIFEKPDFKGSKKILNLLEDMEEKREIKKLPWLQHKYTAENMRYLINLVENPPPAPETIIPMSDFLMDLKQQLKDALEADKGWQAFVSAIDSMDPGEEKNLLIKEKEAVYKSLEDIGKRGITASSSLNRKWNTRMDKIASYHGVLEQGHPSGPTNTPWLSIDKRHIDSSHLKTIVSSAKTFLDSEWFKSGWDYGATEAKYRAALDLAISTSENSIYQSKIDAPTYEILLNSLTGKKIDTFTDTLLPDNNVRKASSQGLPDSVINSYQLLLESGNEIHRTAASNLRRSFETNSDKKIESLLVAADILKNRAVSNELIKHAADLYSSSEVEENKMADTTRIAVDLDTIVKVAYENPKAREALLPIIAAAKGKGKKATPKKESMKKDEACYASDDKKKKSSVKKKVNSVAKKGLTKATAGGKNVRKASDLSISDTEW